MNLLLNNIYNLNKIDIINDIINIIVAALMSQIIYAVFMKFGHTMSNRKAFGKIFLLITVCTTVIISLIQASVALSLGLVGALSIVRFRTAIKEPEELAYLFFCIAMGLGLGADAFLITIISGILIIIILIIRGAFLDKNHEYSYNLSIVTDTLSCEMIYTTLQKNTNDANLRRLDTNNKTISMQFNVDVSEVKMLEETIKVLKALDNNIIINFVTNNTMI